MGRGDGRWGCPPHPPAVWAGLRRGGPGEAIAGLRGAEAGEAWREGMGPAARGGRWKAPPEGERPASASASACLPRPRRLGGSKAGL